MKGKQGGLEMGIMGVIGFVIIILSLIFLFRQAIEGFGVIIASVASLAAIGFVGWFVLDMVN